MAKKESELLRRQRDAARRAAEGLRVQVEALRKSLMETIDANTREVEKLQKSLEASRRNEGIAVRDLRGINERCAALEEKCDALAGDLYQAGLRINRLVEALGVLHRAAVTRPLWVNGNLILEVTTKTLTEEEQREALHDA